MAQPNYKKGIIINVVIKINKKKEKNEFEKVKTCVFFSNVNKRNWKYKNENVILLFDNVFIYNVNII